MPRKVLADGFHACSAHAPYPGIGQVCDGLGIAMKGAITDDAADRIGHVEHRCEAEIDTIVQ